MQYHVICKKIAIACLFSLPMLITLKVIAGNYNNQYSLQTTGGQYNPWVVPQAPENPSEFQQAPKYEKQHRQYRQQRDRFVTEEFLESLKQQQSQHQMMRENGRYPQFPPRQLMPQRPESGSLACPTYGMDYVDPPLYETPVVTPWSPWGIGSEVWR